MRRLLLLVTLAACGDGAPVPVDAPAPGDAAGERSLVTVQYLRDTSLTVDLAVDVYFQDADSSLVLATRALADGTANAFMRAGGYVTVVAPERGQAWTFTDVEAGAHLVIDQRGTSPLDTAYFIYLPPPPPADALEVSTPCSVATIEASPTPGLPIKRCPGGEDLLAVTTSGGLATSYLYADNFVAPTNGSVTLPPPYVPVEPSTIEVTHAPFFAINVEQSLIGSHGRVRTRQVFDQAQSGALVAALDIPQPPGTSLVTDASSTDFSGTPVQHVVTWAPSGPHTSIDLADRTFAVTSPPSFDATTQALRWTEDATGRQPNVVLAQVFTGSGTWTIVAARGAEPVLHLPVIPGDQLRVSEGAFAQLTNLIVPGGLHAAPPGLMTWQIGFPFPTEGPAGHIVYSGSSGFGGIE